ncbi:hypothetical protein [Paenibacillus gallinarum]|uniref:Uncharacterized protein n=1 Tax=Paenibacillus gallinarum TaxID=2762232 RepID=A0ABR8T3D9_9BACL|nr:hypothetical protein [Paenibacillus gallinarum]MBD7970299.1 hypothetical protein [Paenibacillus gallinarum]
MNDYQTKQALLGQLSNWWIQNGWRLDTLKAKSVPELLGIQSRARAQRFNISSHRRRA